MDKVVIIGCNGQLGTDCMTVFGDASVGIDFPEIDISDRVLCRKALDTLQPTVIVNCAAYTAVDACESDPACWRVNGEGPGYLAEWSADHDVFLAHVSTDYVFRGDKPLFEASLESDEPSPISEYGRSKLRGEQAVLESGAQAAILRTAWLHGAHGKNFLKTMLRLTIQNPGKEFKVVHDQFGSPTWSFTLAQQIKAVVDQRAAGIFHASSEGYCSWYDLACSFLNMMEVEHRFIPCTTEEFPTPTRRPANSILENAHAKELGINQFDGWEEELRTFVHAHRHDLLKEVQAS